MNMRKHFPWVSERVIPRRADGEEPRECSAASASHDRVPVESRAVSYLEAQVAIAGSLAVCADRDDS